MSRPCSGLHAGARVAALDARYGSFVDAQLASPPSEWPDSLRADVNGVTTADFPIHERDVDASLDLIVLARRQA